MWETDKQINECLEALEKGKENKKCEEPLGEWKTSSKLKQDAG